MKQESFGELDSTKIATDTAMQVDMDLSYEYQKTLVQNDSVVYDFLAFDRPSKADSKIWESKFIVVKRTQAQNQDTIIRDTRFGPVKGLGLADLNRDGKPEIVFYEDPWPGKWRWRVRIYSPQADGSYKYISWKDAEDRAYAGRNPSADTFFVYEDHLIHRYQYKEGKDTMVTGTYWQSYRLNHDQLVLENEKKVK